jgi:hypothetical protein
MRIAILRAALVLGLSAGPAVLHAQQAEETPTQPAPPPQQQPAPAAPVPEAEQQDPNVLGRSRATGMPELPPREAPRAHVSIVTPQQSRVHKRSRGIRTQDGDGISDGAAQDETSGPNVERLP